MVETENNTPTVLITGATEGIGLELSKAFAREACDLVLVARNMERLQMRKRELETDFKVNVAIIPMDLSLPDAAQKLFATTQKHNMQIDVLVNNAGYGLLGEFSELSLEMQLNMVQLNVVTLTALCHLYIGEMRKRGSGKIMNVASTAAFQPGPLMAVYYATKAYVLHLSEALACELKDSGIEVSVLCPGPTDTAFQKRAGIKDALLTKFKFMPPGPVAEIGIKKFRQGKTVIITGLVNRIFAQSYRFFPRKMIQSVVQKLNKNRG